MNEDRESPSQMQGQFSPISASIDGANIIAPEATHETLPGDGRPHPGDPGPNFSFLQRVQAAAETESLNGAGPQGRQPDRPAVPRFEASQGFMPPVNNGAIFSALERESGSMKRARGADDFAEDPELVNIAHEQWRNQEPSSPRELEPPSQYRVPPNRDESDAQSETTTAVDTERLGELDAEAIYDVPKLKIDNANRAHITTRVFTEYYREEVRPVY